MSDADELRMRELHHFETEQENAAMREALENIRAELPPECWVSRTEDVRCIDFIGGQIGSGSTAFTRDMACLPCRVREHLGDDTEKSGE